MSALKNQVGGMHYTDMPIQPFQYSHANKLDAFQHTVVKYVTRHKNKGGKQDLEKAIHTLQLYIELEYPEPVVPPAATQQAREEDSMPTMSMMRSCVTCRYALVPASRHPCRPCAGTAGKANWEPK